MRDTEDDVVFIDSVINEQIFMDGTLQPGRIYKMHLMHLSIEILGFAINISYIDERIIREFMRKIVSEKKVPLFSFTRMDKKIKIVSGMHVVAAATSLKESYVKGIYVPHSFLTSTKIQEIM